MTINRSDVGRGSPMKEYNIVSRMLYTATHCQADEVCTLPSNVCYRLPEGHDICKCLFFDFLESFTDAHPNWSPAGPHECDDECHGSKYHKCDEDCSYIYGGYNPLKTGITYP